MPKFEFHTLRVQPRDLQANLDVLGARGFQVISTDVVSNKVIVILQREKVGRPKKKKK